MRKAFACAKVLGMKLTEWLDADRGRLKALSTHFGLTQSAVCQWRTNGVPPARMKAVREFTQGAVSLDDMLPDPCDGAATAAQRQAA